MSDTHLPPLSITPKHIAIIMDGNNRYGKSQNLATGQGHVKGKDALDPIVEHCLQRGVQVLTVFAFSSENWARPKAEVDLLMDLLAQTIHEQMPRMHKYRIRLKFIGEREHLSDKLATLMADAERETAQFDAMTLVIAISYGGQWDIANAAKILAKDAIDGKINIDQIDADALGNHIQLSDYPPVDMLIRTGGDYRISNFLLWQIAYAELFFTPTLWPEFGCDELDEMMQAFANRERRFGKTSEQIANDGQHTRS
ncbi:UDP diphosphate synthase [Moraxella ovis]|uniref:Ditrans,polycis-undecaprenyl-diphosphate synthase ((2E,6E)-farnesyl-diphosphate specific) n=1 Tax=Moraxella ovis TaxID=29433 RepID=A0A378PJB1_9GAMM|nr:polyprenyl diphosphate synthase [Moraxella ovis]ANB91291.1 UDP diphosphate synthase [Moraxella ovis]STY86855.1 Undecaprenyl pyrophosphate synthase [Moraxella ovis]